MCPRKMNIKIQYYSLIKDIDAFNNDSYNVRGSFGQAMAYSSDVCKEKMELLKQFAEQNMASAMSDVGEYDSNYEQIKGIVVPIAGSIDKVKFMDNGSISIPNLSGTAFAQSHISQAETLNKRNMAIKDRLEALTNERIDRVG